MTKFDENKVNLLVLDQLLKELDPNEIIKLSSFTNLYNLAYTLAVQ